MSDDDSMMPVNVVVPDHFFEPNGVPIFKPTFEQFKDFASYVKAIEPFGRETGIVKIIPPPEWSCSVKDVATKLPKIRIKTPIKQDFAGGGLPPGTYRQMNMEVRRTYSVQSWYECAQGKERKPPLFQDDGKVLHESDPARGKRRKVVAAKGEAEVPRPVGSSSTSAPQLPKTVPETVAVKPTLMAASETQTQKTADVTNKVDMSAISVSTNFGAVLGVCDDPAPKVEQLSMIANAANTSLASPPESSNGGTVIKLDSVEDSANQNAAAGTSEPTPATCGQTSEVEVITPKKRKRGIYPDEPILFDLASTANGYTLSYCRELERFYWRNITYLSPMYGADMLGTLFDQDEPLSWNLNHLDNILAKVKVPLPGVNQPYLYFGMWKATFAWHVEDMDLYSIKYKCSSTAPKQWYVIPTSQSGRFERVAKGLYCEEAKRCPAFLRHKTCLISPSSLAHHGIEVHKMIQFAGEFVITFPYGYHSGFNYGFNCAESVNFATEDWIEVGKRADFCQCVKDSVKLDVAGLFETPPAEPDLIEAEIFEDESTRMEVCIGPETEDEEEVVVQQHVVEPKKPKPH
ncbi:hypothetical protein HDU76_001578, partial [Blyttiomyces sp. JEL0837]